MSKETLVFEELGRAVRIPESDLNWFFEDFPSRSMYRGADAEWRNDAVSYIEKFRLGRDDVILYVFGRGVRPTNYPAEEVDE